MSVFRTDRWRRHTALANEKCPRYRNGLRSALTLCEKHQKCARSYSGPENVLLRLSATRTAKTAASVRCLTPIFNRRFET